MADPKLRDEEARQRKREDEIMRGDRRTLGPSGAPRHIRGMLPGGRMYGEDDSVVGYFSGHAVRLTKLAARFTRVFFRRKPRADEIDGPLQYRDYDPDL